VFSESCSNNIASRESDWGSNPRAESARESDSVVREGSTGQRNWLTIHLTADIRGSRNGNCRMSSMTNSEERSPPAVGVHWINEGDYPALLSIFPDGNRMPRTWAEWLKIAEEMESGLKAYGHVVMRVPIDPNTFRDWCAAHGTSPGSQGRKRFVAEAVTERFGKQN
jgi:hypothetical protein